MIKKLAKTYLLKLHFFRRLHDDGYAQVGARLLFLNFIFQRILRNSADAPFSVNYKSTFVCARNIEYGKFTAKSFAISPGLYIQGGNGVKFGSNVLLGPNVAIISSNHGLNNRSIWLYSAPVVIHDNVWVGANSTILPGVTIGENTIVGAGSVVTKSFEKNLIVAGNPARILRKM